MNTIILWDIDGVIIRHKSYFGDQLKIDEYNNPVEILNEFRLTGINQLCDRGEIDPLISISPFLKRIGWVSTSEEYFNAQYKYEDQYIDDNLLQKIKGLRKYGIKNYIATNQNYYRMNHLLDRLDIKNNFDGYFVSNTLKAVKTEEIYWIKVLEQIKNENIEIEKIIFIDDMKENVEKAKEYGINGIVANTEKKIEDIFMKLRVSV